MLKAIPTCELRADGLNFVIRRPQKIVALKNDQSNPSKHTVSGQILELVLRLLPLKVLAQAALVCRQWNKVSFTTFLKQKFPSLKVLDETYWETHTNLTQLGLEVDDAPLLDKMATINDLNRLFSLKRERNTRGHDAGVTLVTIPSNHALLKLVELVQLLNARGARIYFEVVEDVLEKLGKNSAAKAYVVALTNSVLEGSRDMEYVDHAVLSKEICFEMPELLATATLGVLTKIPFLANLDTGIFRTKTFTRCSDRVSLANAIVGGLNGLEVDKVSMLGIKNRGVGLGAMVRIKTINP